MGDAEITASSWRLVQVGRIVQFGPGPYSGRLAVIVEIVDHKRVLVDGPASDASKAVPRHSAPLSNISLTPQVIAKLPRSIGTGPLKKVWEKEGIEENFGNSQLAKNRAQRERRKQLNDFERYKVMRLKKQVRFQQKKALAKIKASA